MDKFNRPRNRDSLGEFLQCLLVSWGLFGHNSLVLIAASMNLETRSLTVPSRAITAFLAVLTINVLFLRSSATFRGWPVLAFLAFWSMYAIRLVLDLSDESGMERFDPRLGLDYIAFMAVGSCLLPSLSILINLNWSWHRLTRLFCAVLVGFAGAVIIGLYREPIRYFENRMSPGGMSGNAVTVHALALGYTGAVLLVFAFYFLSTMRTGFLRRAALGILFGGVGIALIVGSASRGPVFSVAVAAVVLLFSLSRRLNFGRLLVLMSATCMVLVGAMVFAEATGSSLFDRVFRIKNAIAGETDEAIRIDIYGLALQRFAQSPLVGSSTILRGASLPHGEAYPHNLFVESLMATGLLGTVPLVFLVGFAVWSSWRVLIHRPDLAWVPLIFVVFLTAAQFSGAIFTNVGFWISLAATISCSEWMSRSNSSYCLCDRPE